MCSFFTIRNRFNFICFIHEELFTAQVTLDIRMSGCEMCLRTLSEPFILRTRRLKVNWKMTCFLKMFLAAGRKILKI